MIKFLIALLFTPVMALAASGTIDFAGTSSGGGAGAGTWLATALSSADSVSNTAMGTARPGILGDTTNAIGIITKDVPLLNTTNIGAWINIVAASIIEPTSAKAAGGVWLQGGHSAGTNDGGELDLYAGDANGSGDGGWVYINSGGAAGPGNAGSIEIRPGAGAGTANGGDVVIAVGTGSPKGTIFLQPNAASPHATVGYVWTATDTEGAGDWQAAAGGGVTSVAMTVPNILSVAGSPVTTTGTLAVTLATQAANLVFAGPTSGAAATPAFRALVSGDMPNIAPRSVTSTDNATATDVDLDLSGASFTETLPVPTGNNGKKYTLTHAGTSLSQIYTLAIATSGGFITSAGTIASGSYKLVTVGESVTVQSNGTNYIVRSHYAKSGVTTYSPTFNSTTGHASSAFQWYRDGKHMYIDGQIVWNGAGPSSALTVTLPNTSNLAVDTTFLATGSGSAGEVAGLMGSATWFDTGTQRKAVFPKYTGTATNFGVYEFSGTFLTSLAANGDNMYIQAKIPIDVFQP